MTSTYDARARPADPPREAALSVAALAGSLTTYLAFTWLVEDRIGFLTSAWLVPAVYVLTVACPVLLRARSARRRRWAAGVLAAMMVAMLLPAVVLAQVGGSELVWSFGWVFEMSNVAGFVLVLAAWGLARRHGRWWWLGLAPAYGILLALPYVELAVIRLGPEWIRDAGLWTVGLLALVLGGLCCWLVDILVTRPLHARGSLGA